MKAKQDLLPWSTLLYAFVVLASLPMTTRVAGGQAPLGFDPALAMIVAQLGTILVPTLIFLAFVRQPASELLNLRSLDFRSGIKSLLVGVFCWPFLTCLSILAMILVGLLQPAAPVDLTSTPDPGGSPWLLFFGVVLVAPLCEELLFRGVLLSTYQRRLGMHAVWLVAILFGFLHPNFSQALGALFIGVIVGWLVYRTRSVWAGILVHFGTNLVGGGIALLASLAAPGATQAATSAQSTGATLWIGALVWAVIGLVMLLPVFLLLRSIARRHAALEAPGTDLSWRSLWAPGAAVIGVIGYALYDLLQSP